MLTHLRPHLVWILLFSSIGLGATWKELADKLAKDPKDGWPAALGALTKKDFRLPSDIHEIYHLRWILRQVADNVGSKENVRRQAKTIIKRLGGSEFAEAALIRYRTALAIRKKRPNEATKLLNQALSRYQTFGSAKYSLEKSSIRLALLELALKEGKIYRNELKEPLNAFVRRAVDVFVQPDGFGLYPNDASNETLRNEQDSKKERLVEFLKRVIKIGQTKENTKLARELLTELEKIKDLRSFDHFNVIDRVRKEPTNPAKTREELDKSWLPWLDKMIAIGRADLAETLGRILNSDNLDGFDLQSKVASALYAQKEIPAATGELKAIHERIVSKIAMLTAEERFQHLTRLEPLVRAIDDTKFSREFLEDILSASKEAKNADWLKQHWSALSKHYENLAYIYREQDEAAKAVVAMRQSLYLTRRYAKTDGEKASAENRAMQLSDLKANLSWRESCLDLFGGSRGVPLVF